MARIHQSTPNQASKVESFEFSQTNAQQNVLPGITYKKMGEKQWGFARQRWFRGRVLGWCSPEKVRTSTNPGESGGMKPPSKKAPKPPVFIISGFSQGGPRTTHSPPSLSPIPPVLSHLFGSLDKSGAQLLVFFCCFFACCQVVSLLGCARCREGQLPPIGRSRLGHCSHGG